MDGVPTYPVQGSEHLAFTSAWVVAALAAVVLVVRFARRFLSRTGPGRGGAAPDLLVPAVFVVTALVAGTLALRPWQWEVPVQPDVGRRWHPDTFWYARTDGLPALADGDEVARLIGDRPLRIAAGGGREAGAVRGQPVNLVDHSTPRHDVTMYGYGVHLQDPGPYPIPDRVLQQGFPLGAWDTKVVMVDPEAGLTYELATARRFFGRWYALAAAVWDPTDPSLDKPGHTTVSRLPLLPGRVHPEEVEAGRIDHMLWGVAPNLHDERFIWPALGTDGTNPDPDAIPMGSVLRLRADYPVEELPPQARVVARALQEFGMVLGDSAPEIGIGGISDGRWDNRQIAAFSRITTRDLELVEITPLRVSERSMLVNAPGGVPRPAPSGGG